MIFWVSLLALVYCLHAKFFPPAIAIVAWMIFQWFARGKRQIAKKSPRSGK